MNGYRVCKWILLVSVEGCLFRSWFMDRSRENIQRSDHGCRQGLKVMLVFGEKTHRFSTHTGTV